MNEELFAAEELEVGILDPAGAQFLIGEIERMLEDGDPFGYRAEFIILVRIAKTAQTLEQLQ